MERRRCLADALAVTAGELLTDVLDDFPLPRNDLQRLGDVLAELGQPGLRRRQAQAAGAGHDHPLARQVFGETAYVSYACGVNAATFVVLATAFSAASSSSAAAASSSSNCNSI